MNTAIVQPMPPVANEDQPTAQQENSEPIPSDKTPQDFYEEITRRPNVRAILEELARG
jgi:hypothetical protein